MSAAARRTLAPLAVVTAAAFVFALLLVLVRLQWAPLESADHGAAARLNSLVAGHAVAIGIVKAVTWLGSSGVLWALIGMAAVVLAIRRRWRLAIYLLVTGAGATSVLVDDDLFFLTTGAGHDPDVRRLRVGSEIDVGHAEDYPLPVGRDLRVADALQLHHVFEREGMLGLGESRNGECKNKKRQKNTAQ